MPKFVLYAAGIFTLLLFGVLGVGVSMGWSHERWKAVGAIVSGVGSFLTGTSVLAAGWYFLFQKYRGYHVPNLSVGITCERRPSGDHADDWLAISISLKKGDRALLTLKPPLARVTCLEKQTDTRSKEVEFWGWQRIRIQKDRVDWEPKDGHVEPLNLPPGEETRLTTALRVNAKDTYRVDVAILANQVGDKDEKTGKPKVGEWHASAVSMPLLNKPRRLTLPEHGA